MAWCFPWRPASSTAALPTAPAASPSAYAGMLSINGTTVESVASNMRDQSLLQLRMDNTSAGADFGGGTAGLLGFSQKMTQSDEHFSVADVRKILPAQGGGNIVDSESTTSEEASAGGWTAANALDPFLTTDERSDKHQILLNNCSNKRRSDGVPFSTTAAAGGVDYAGARQPSENLVQNHRARLFQFK